MKAAIPFLAAALLASVPASAQSGNPFDHIAAANARQRPPSTDLAIQAMHNFSRCVVDRGDRGARALLAMDFRSADYRRALSRLAKGHDYCAPGSQIRFNGLLFAGGLAERMIEKSVGQKNFVSAVAFDPAKPAVEARSAMEMIGLCTARKAPQETAAIFATEPASSAEDRAMQAVGPALVACVAAGQKVTLNRPGLRAVLALGSYRLIQNNYPDMLSGAGS